jgi:hypothetical protein
VFIRKRSVLARTAVATAAAAATALAIGVIPRVAPPAAGFGALDDSDEAPQSAGRPLMASVTPDRLSAALGRPYGVRFAADTASDRVEVSGASLAEGGRLDVVLFGGLPGSVHGMACEVGRTDVEGAAELLAACARVAAGDSGAPVVAAWIRAELGAPAGGGAWSAVVGATRYALRAVPAEGSWALAMSPEGS